MKKSLRKNGDVTRLAILDAAEELFAHAGLDGVTVRQIAKQADVGLSLVTYHFESKERLFEQVVTRRSEVINTMRREALEKCMKSSDVDLPKIVDAYTSPILKFEQLDSQSWSNVGDLLAQVAQTRKYSSIISGHFDETARLFVDALRMIYPQSHPDNAIKAVIYSVTVMISIFSASRRIESLSEGKITNSDPTAYYPSITCFICGGIDAIMSSKS